MQKQGTAKTRVYYGIERTQRGKKAKAAPTAHQFESKRDRDEWIARVEGEKTRRVPLEGTTIRITRSPATKDEVDEVLATMKMQGIVRHSYDF